MDTEFLLEMLRNFWKCMLLMIVQPCECVILNAAGLCNATFSEIEKRMT